MAPLVETYWIASCPACRSGARGQSARIRFLKDVSSTTTGVSGDAALPECKIKDHVQLLEKSEFVCYPLPGINQGLLFHIAAQKN